MAEAGLETLAAVETPEQIGLDVEIAGIGSRFVAYLIDLAWQSAILIAALIGAFLLARAGGLAVTTRDPTHLFLTNWAVALVNLSFFAVNFGYFTFFELVWGGQSPGKRHLGLRVVREGGYPLTFGASFLRNLLRIVDFLPFAYLVGITAAVIGPRWQRVGDLAARTWVVRESPEGVSRITAPDSERQLAMDLLGRIGSIEPAIADDLVVKLAERIAAGRGEPPPAAPAAYLTAVANDARA